MNRSIYLALADYFFLKYTYASYEMASNAYVSYCCAYDKILKCFDLFKSVPDNRDLDMQEHDAEQDQSGKEESVPEDDYIGDVSCDITDDDEQLATWQGVEVCCVANDDDERKRRDHQAVRFDA